MSSKRSLDSERAPHSAGAPVERAKDGVVKIISAYIPEALAIEIRDFCHTYNTSITDLVDNALKEYIERHKKE